MAQQTAEPQKRGEETYSALIVYQGGSGIDENIVDHHHEDQTLVVEYADGRTTIYPFGSIDELNPNANGDDVQFQVKSNSSGVSINVYDGAENLLDEGWFLWSELGVEKEDFTPSRTGTLFNYTKEE